MILTVDIGNSNIVIGVFKEDELLFTLRIKTDATRTCDEYTINLNSMLRINGLRADDIEGAIISSVVPNLSMVMSDAILRLIGKRPLMVGPGLKTGLNIRIDDPSQLGSDLVADAVGAVAKYGKPVIIVDMGTATTVSAVAPDGGFLGGAIAPGVMISMNALASGAAQISQINIESPERAIGTNTTASLKSGIVFGYAGLLDGLISRFEREIGQPCTVVATGGLSGEITKHCKHEIIHDKDLLVKGLLLIYKRNV